MAALSLQPWQWAVIAAVWVVFFLLPAPWMWRKAKADGDESPFVWTVLVLVGSFVGIIEYYHHRSILARREKRRARAEGGGREAEGAGGPEGDAARAPAGPPPPAAPRPSPPASRHPEGERK